MKSFYNEKLSLEELQAENELDKIWFTVDERDENYARAGLRVMQSMVVPDAKSTQEVEANSGMYNCLLWSQDPTQREPFRIRYALMNDPDDDDSDYEDDVIDDRFNKNKKLLTWSTLPEWFENINGRNFRALKLKWSGALLPIVEQWKLIDAQSQLITGTNNNLDRYDSNGEVNERSLNPFYRVYSRYIGNEFQIVNRVLRDLPEYGREMCLDMDLVNYMQYLQWMITILPPVNVDWRAYRYSAEIEALKIASPGDILAFRGYTSASMNILKTINIVNWYAGSNDVHSKRMVFMELIIPTGSRFLIVPSKENEVIFPHYSEFRLVSKRKASTYITYIVLEMINDPTQCSRRMYSNKWI